MTRERRRDVEYENFSVACRAGKDEQPPAQVVVALAGLGDDATQPTRPKGPAMIIQAADSTDGMTGVALWREVRPRGDVRQVFITEVGDEREIASSTEQSTGEIEVVSASREPNRSRLFWRRTYGRQGLSMSRPPKLLWALHRLLRCSQLPDLPVDWPEGKKAITWVLGQSEGMASMPSGR